MKAVRMKPCLDVVLDILYNLDVMSLAYVSWFIDFVKINVKLRRTFYVLTLTKTITAYFQDKYRNYSPRGVLKTEGVARGFQHSPRDLANVNEWQNHV